MKSHANTLPLSATVLLALTWIACLLPGLATVGIAQETKGNPPAIKKPDRWDSQPRLTDAAVRTAERVYKSTPQGELKLHLWSPQAEGKDRPCIVFFFGGGWTSGTYRQFARQAEYLASRGMVAASADYRIRKLHNTTPDLCVEDAKSAIRWVRAHAEELGIDPDKVIAGGGSAGGHLAAATALVPGFDAPGEDLSISAIPNAMVLYNPGLNPSANGREILDGQRKPIAKAISPNLFLHAKTPPAILFFGTADPLAASGIEYVAKAEELGLDVESWWAADQPHGFFNETPWLEVTTQRLDRFLTRLGYLSGEPTLVLPGNAPSLKPTNPTPR